jgi:hypothetical protein
VDALALPLPLPLLALVPDRAGLLLEAFPRFEALDCPLRGLPPEPPAFAPLELREDRCFCLLDDRGFPCAITPPWVSTAVGSADRIPR